MKSNPDLELMLGNDKVDTVSFNVTVPENPYENANLTAAFNTSAGQVLIESIPGIDYASNTSLDEAVFSLKTMARHETHRRIIGSNVIQSLGMVTGNRALVSIGQSSDTSVHEAFGLLQKSFTQRKRWPSHSTFAFTKTYTATESLQSRKHPETLTDAVVAIQALTGYPDLMSYFLYDEDSLGLMTTLTIQNSHKDTQRHTQKVTTSNFAVLLPFMNVYGGNTIFRLNLLATNDRSRGSEVTLSAASTVPEVKIIFASEKDRIRQKLLSTYKRASAELINAYQN